MPQPRVYKTQAVVLRQRKLGEADKIVTLYCSHLGKVDGVAKGIRRTKSRLAGHLEPLTFGSYLLAEGRNLDVITQAETIDAFPKIRGDLHRLSLGIYCTELVDRLVPLRSEGNPIFPPASRDASSPRSAGCNRTGCSPVRDALARPTWLPAGDEQLRRL